jgi:hypothetical protein
MDFLKYLDLFEIKFNFYIHNQPNYQNFFGGIMSIVFYCVCFLGFIIFTIDDLKQLNPISSKSEIPDAGLRTVNVSKEKIWIPFRMVTYEEQFVDHRGILFPLLYFVEGKWDDKTGMDLKYTLLNYKLCNETSMANKPDNFKINVPLNELFCIDNDDLTFGGSWNGNYLYFIEYNLHLCQDGINFNVSDPRCTKIEDLLAHKNTSWLFEFYYPVVQFQPTNFEVPLAVIYRSYFYRLATHSNKVERIYISQNILTDDKSLLKSNKHNSSIWGMSSLYGDDYYMEYTFDPIVKSTSSRLYSLDIYMDQGLIYYKRSYRKLFLIISDFFPILRLILLIIKKFTQHMKISISKRHLAGLIFENVKMKHNKRLSKNVDKYNNNSMNQIANRVNLETNNNSKKGLKKINHTNIDNEFNDPPSSLVEIAKLNKKPKAKNYNFFEKNNNHLMLKKNSDTDIKNNFSFNKSNISLNNENFIQMLNKNGIKSFNQNNNNNNSFILYKESKLKNFYTSSKLKKMSEKRKLFPYLYFFLDIFFDRMKRPKKFCLVPKKYFIVYNYMSQIYDISSHILLFKNFNILNNFIVESISKQFDCSFDNNRKININDNRVIEHLDMELKTKKCVIFANTFS